MPPAGSILRRGSGAAWVTARTGNGSTTGPRSRWTRPGPADGRGHWLLVRQQTTPGEGKTVVERAYYRCAGLTSTPLRELIRVAGARWAIEERSPQERGWARPRPGPAPAGLVRPHHPRDALAAGGSPSPAPTNTTPIGSTRGIRGTRSCTATTQPDRDELIPLTAKPRIVSRPPSSRPPRPSPRSPLRPAPELVTPAAPPSVPGPTLPLPPTRRNTIRVEPGAVAVLGGRGSFTAVLTHLRVPSRSGCRTDGAVVVGALALPS